MIEENRKNDLWSYVERHAAQIENALAAYLPLAPPFVETRFNEAARYALFSGGKRLRPILTLLGAELFGASPETVLPAACAVEFIHTSSLIFDDLPCMDNAGERRGKVSLHEKFGEGLAILAAIGFLNSAYGLIFVGQENNVERAVRAHRETVECVGAAGMLGGQSVDLALAAAAAAANLQTGSYDSEAIKNLKTSALMRLALRVGAISAGAEAREKLRALAAFANLLGDAYQLSDDLIDWSEDTEIFRQAKTFAINQGTNAAREKLENLIEDAKTVLTENFAASDARAHLLQLSDYLAVRKA